MAEAWNAFKEESDLGRKADQEKLARLNSAMDAISDRQGELEVVLKRPRIGTSVADEFSWNERLESKAFHNYLRQGDQKMEPDEAKALVVADDTAGGYLAPSSFSNELVKAVVEMSPFRSVARVMNIGSRSIRIPKRTGTFSAVWTGESSTRSETEGLTFGQTEIIAPELYALVDLSNQLIEDSEVNIQSELSSEFAGQFAVAEGAAFINGNAAERPQGIMDSSVSGFAEVASGAANALAHATEAEADGFIDAFHALKTAYAQNGTWLLNRTTLAEVRKLKDSQNQYIWQPGLADLRPNTILGAPYVEMPDMPDVAANAYPVAFGDWRRAYRIVDRISMSVLRDPYTQQTSGNVRFHARRRVGGAVVLGEAFVKLKIATTV